MGFDQRQRKALRSKMRHANVRSRIHNGTTLHYIEGWRVVAEANRIFGHENWDRETRAPTCIWSDRQRGQVVCLYSTQVRISVRAGDTIVIRDGVGTGFGRASSPEGAHEMAMKAAETDATKRALATFGNPFGLALYDKEMSQVTRPTNNDQPPDKRSSKTEAPKVILTGRNGRQRRLSSSEHLVEAVTTSLAELETIEAV
jgi:DNA recombination protein Rad52